MHTLASVLLPSCFECQKRIPREIFGQIGSSQHLYSGDGKISFLTHIDFITMHLAAMRKM